MQDEKIHLRSYSLEIMSCRMIRKRNQRHCVKDAERLVYTENQSAALVEVHIVRVNKEIDEEYFIDEEEEVILVRHDSSASVNAILVATRSELKKNVKSFKHHEFIRRILKRKIKKEKKLSIAKTIRQEN